MGNAVRREKSAAKKDAAMEQAGARGPAKKGGFLAGLAAKSPKKSKEDSPEAKKAVEEDKEKTDVELEEEEQALQSEEGKEGKEEAEDKEKTKNAQAPQTPKDKEEEAPAPDETVLKKEAKKLLHKLNRLAKQKRLNKRRAWKLMKAIVEIWEAYLAQGLKPESRIVRRQADVMLKLSKQPLQHWFDRPAKTGKVTQRTLKKLNTYMRTPRNIGKADKTASDPR